MSEGNQREKGTKPIPLAGCQTPWTLPEQDNNTNWLIVFSQKPFPFILLPNCSCCCVWAAQLNSVLLLLGISAWSTWESKQPWESTAAWGWLCEQGFANENYQWSKGGHTATAGGEARTGMRSKEHRMGVRNWAKLLLPLLKVTLELFQDVQTLSSSPFAWVTTNKTAKCVMKGCWLDLLSPLKIEYLFLHPFQPEMRFHFLCFVRIKNYSLDVCR